MSENLNWILYSNPRGAGQSPALIGNYPTKGELVKVMTMLKSPKSAIRRDGFTYYFTLPENK